MPPPAEEGHPCAGLKSRACPLLRSLSITTNLRDNDFAAGVIDMERYGQRVNKQEAFGAET
jgi:hypothetical protein